MYASLIAGFICRTPFSAAAMLQLPAADASPTATAIGPNTGTG